MHFDDDITASLRVLQQGGIILYPTDTVWGIGCDASNEKAVARIFELKKRPDEKSMIVLLADEQEISNYVDEPGPKIFDYIKGVKKPTTVIYNAAKGLAKNLVNKDGSIAIRLVQERFCSKLIRLFGKPIVSTSANLSGYPPAGNFIDIDIEIIKGVDYVVQYRQDDEEIKEPSSIVKINPDGSITVIRK